MRWLAGASPACNDHGRNVLQSIGSHQTFSLCSSVLAAFHRLNQVVRSLQILDFLSCIGGGPFYRTGMLEPKHVGKNPQNSTPAAQKKQPAWMEPAFIFAQRHNGPQDEDLRQMLAVCGFDSLEAMADAAVPAAIRRHAPLNLPPAIGESEALAELKALAAKNEVYRSFIGMGYSNCITPPVIQRNILENPGWYTQYTPYQAEISQGRLEALLNFQTMVCDLTAMEVANASLLDEATAAAEAMTMARAIKKSTPGNTFFVSDKCHPQTIDVLRTRATPHGIKIVVGDHRALKLTPDVFAVLVQYPGTDGSVQDEKEFADRVHAAGALLVVAADLMSLVLLRPPGEWGADIVVGSSQRFGVPMAYGGPHAAFFATRDQFKRQMPGRLIGVSRDAQDRPALRLALQTREQHIRREKATSNICTAQVLLAIMASMYAVYHGPEGLKRIARRIHGLTRLLAHGLEKMGYRLAQTEYFDTLRIELGSRSSAWLTSLALRHRINVRVFGPHTVGVSLDETTTIADVETLWRIFNEDRDTGFDATCLAEEIHVEFSAPLARTSGFLKEVVFNRHHSETEMLRYIKRLESKDLSLATAMIPLGSCTMKLNAAAEMYPITWPEFASLHPFAPADQARGYAELVKQLEQWLAEITGFAGVTLQPNAGSQGEYTGLTVIRRFLESKGQTQRQICLIPQSAHGTNPASAASAGFQVIPVACDAQGNIDLTDLRAKAEAYSNQLAAMMVTYPSTHGVFEEGIKEICQIVHEHGGQLYMDGANMNAQVGLCRPGDIGADVCHLNLHKTFSIPHGGGGPGVGPICVAPHLLPFLPGNVVTPAGNRPMGAVSAALYGSAGILPISWMYIRMMGPDGLLLATETAILNANYIARKLQDYYPTLYKGARNLVAHECLLDLRHFHTITVEDVAKRLMDFGFHAPTISWPVGGTVMIEPTESESKAELDRFCEAMIAIHAEIQAVESGSIDRHNNPLKNAPHPASVVAAETWDRPYTRTQAAYPSAWSQEFKFWPACSRIDNVYGDRNPVCVCEA
jgi:glycine dehydrogenase